jgi:hypothetical protein
VNARWLAARWPDDLRIDRGATQSPQKLDALLERLSVPAEAQIFDDGTLGAAEWIRLASGRRRGGEPAWLFRECAAAGLDPVFIEHVYDEAEPALHWRLAFEASRTGNRIAQARPAFRSDMRRLPVDVSRWIARWSGTVRHVSPAEGRRLIDVARAALLVRNREVYSHERANPADVHRALLGEGAEVVFMGVMPDRRLSLEANYGYIFLANGVPIGYGGFTALFGQGNTGINIFDDFRRGESAFLFAGLLGAVRRLFGCTRFIINPYQFGAGNPEAIQSGAFWFYYRLGFRPVDPAIRRRAERESARLAAGRRRRTPAAMLRKFAECDVELALPGRAPPRFEEGWLARLAENATRLLAEHPGATREGNRRRLARQVSRALRIDTRRWAAGERRALSDLAPVLAQLPELSRWPARECRALAALVRAKGAAGELRFAQLAARHGFLRRAIGRAARRIIRGESGSSPA